MKIVLATYGSRGDVQPMLALTLALQSQGHAVLLAGPPEKEKWAREMGCPYRPLGSDITRVIDGMGKAHAPQAAIRFIRHMRREFVAQFRILPEVIADADLVVGASLVFGLSSVA